MSWNLNQYDMLSHAKRERPKIIANPNIIERVELLKDPISYNMI